jgi:hypothetical protein
VFSGSPSKTSGSTPTKAQLLKSLKIRPHFSQSAIHLRNSDCPCAEVSKVRRKVSDFAFFSTLFEQKSGNHPIPKQED